MISSTNVECKFLSYFSSWEVWNFLNLIVFSTQNYASKLSLVFIPVKGREEEENKKNC